MARSISISKTGSTTSSISVSASWSADAGGDTVYFVKDGNTQTTKSVSGTSGTETYTYTGLSSGTTYTLEAIIMDDNLDSTGDSGNYSTDSANSSPYTPNLQSPSDGSTISDSTPTFSVTASDPDGDSVMVEVETYYSWDTDYVYDFLSSGYKSSGSTFYLNTSTEYNDDDYVWRARAYDGSSYSSWSSFDSFTVDSNNAPYTPSNLSPGDGTTINDNDVDISAKVSDPDGDNVRLIIHVSTDSNFSSYDSYNSSFVSSGSTVTRNVGTFSDGTYYWRAKAEDSQYVDSGYTSTRSFIISQRPPDWSWSSTYTKGDPFNITATEWNDFTARINDFRDYKGFSFYSFSALAGAGKNANASHFNEAIDAIDDMNPPTLPPSTKVGVSDVVNPSDADDVATDDFDLIRDSLNSIQ